MKTLISRYSLFEYLAGRANPLEKQLIEDWIMQKENSEQFHQWLMEYEISHPQFAPEQDTALENLLNRLNEDLPEQEEKESPAPAQLKSSFQSFGNRFWLIAASVILVVGCCLWFRDDIQYKTYQTGYGKTTDIYLEDGSKVALNSNSKLKIPRFGFDRALRQVMLEGEAEFSVSHTVDSKKFIVKTSDKFKVEVLGTTFSVYARPRGTKVSLTSGSVRIDYSRDEQHKNLMMVPGDLVTLDKAGEVQVARKQDTKTFATWKEQRYVFNATSMQEIAALLEENFGQKVTLADSAIAQRTITGNFKTRNAEELLRTISEVLDMKIERNGSTISLMNN
ncbi:FecR family protein [Dyadobacter sp. Leaf189]|uniref:FecR family protein n=1 Tax=Dyadobacter sp. Leaf189 TaxID=1736295 RepID=UPI0006FAC4CC|nr:FecR domain-containing protein [Dyadobacter sp. Leaf189]KQS33364.1 iron dicitrate transport regulator FecR [Dyadobacter sp. Leaf189]